jgi:DnaJ family protein A protein 2
VLIVQEKPHSLFKRKDDDLIMEKRISLVQALCGVDFLFEHLDGRIVRVQSVPGTAIRPGDVKVMEEEGMPRNENPSLRGLLFVKFIIEFPSDEDILMRRKPLLSILGPLPSMSGEKHDYDVALQEFHPDEASSSNQHHSARRAYEEDEEDEDGQQQGVRCAQQ